MTIFSFLPISKSTDGAGRIRTSDLQRPRLASCQARQRPRLAGCLDAIRIICLLIHLVDNLSVLSFIELEKHVIILLLLPLVQPLHLVCELTLDEEALIKSTHSFQAVGLCSELGTDT